MAKASGDESKARRGKRQYELATTYWQRKGRANAVSSARVQGRPSTLAMREIAVGWSSPCSEVKISNTSTPGPLLQSSSRDPLLNVIALIVSPEELTMGTVGCEGSIQRDAAEHIVLRIRCAVASTIALNPLSLFVRSVQRNNLTTGQACIHPGSQYCPTLSPVVRSKRTSSLVSGASTSSAP